MNALVLTGLILHTVSDGYVFGQMSGMLADLQSANSTIPLTDNDISWIASTMNLTCVFGYALAALLSEKFGKRRAISLLSSPIMASWLMIYYAQDFTVIMMSRVLVGVCLGGVIGLIYFTTAEYMVPKFRQFCVYIVLSVGTAVGTTLGHILGILLHWRTAALVGIIPTSLSALLPLLWVESPQWLASKGKFKECENAFKALFEENTVMKTEFQLLLQVERSKIEKSSVNKESLWSVMKMWLKAMKQKYFWKLLLMGSVVGLYRAAAGKILFSTCAATIIENVTGHSDILFFTLLVDGLLILGSSLACFLINIMKMRTLLFSTGITANVMLLILSVCLYYNSGKNDIYFAWTNTILLGMYFVTVFAGPYPVVETLLTEIYPNELKNYFLFLIGSINGIFIFLSVNLASKMFALYGLHGVFFINAIIMCVCLLYFWQYVPETKGRTLQEIELFFKNNTFKNVNDIINSDQTKELI